MTMVDLHEADSQLARLVEEAAQGQEVIIAKAGQPYVRLVSCLPERVPRVLGGWEGRVRISPDFDRTSEDVIAAFDGRRPSN